MALKIKQVTSYFVKAILKRDLKLLSHLLDEQFDYFDGKRKDETLEYFKKQFEFEIPFHLQLKEVEMYYCKGCRPGNIALVFNNGFWPVVDFNQPKAIMLSFLGNHISDITLCYDYCSEKKIIEIARQN